MNPIAKAMQAVQEQVEIRKRAVASWQGRINEIAKRDSCSRTQAAETLRREDPAGFEAFQSA